MAATPPLTPAPAPAFMPAAALPYTPKYHVKQGRNTNTITIGAWTIQSTKKPILNGKEIDAVEKQLNLPLPEMTFGNNHLRLTYSASEASATSSSSTYPSSSRPQARDSSTAVTNIDINNTVELRFDTLEALAGVATGEGWEERVGGGVKVSMADKWKHRASPQSFLTDTPMASKPVKPHDWTFSTCYAGSVAGPSTFKPSPTHSLPLPLLARQDPVLDRILFYDDVPLYEDELHDHGESILNARIRVMPHSFFILARLFVRVDDVLFRLYDVRVYHAFGSDEVIREVSGMECTYDEVKRRLERPSDLSPLTDANWVNSVMSAITSSATAAVSDNGSASKPWPGLGKRVEVLVLPRADASAGTGAAAQGDVEGIREGLDEVRIA
ncbi:hypothetical protein I317_00223 [Kwoniella heveanensis CBS 569]|nr:hypothetical protein I317_00223 [Kwoniella heveanensis CBS 569]